MDKIKNIKDTRLFLDMDGVFCDFEKSAQEKTGKFSRNTDDAAFWPVVMKKEMDEPMTEENNAHFFEQLDPMPEAKGLWKVVNDFLERSGQVNPIFLTGCPKAPYREFAEKGKEAWVRKHFLETGGEIYTLSVPISFKTESERAEINETLENLLRSAKPKDILMIFCRPDQKQLFNQSGGKVALLLDDRYKTKAGWDSAGTSIFLHHPSEPTRTNTAAQRTLKSIKAVRNSMATLKSMRGGARHKALTKRRKRKQKRRD